MRCSAKSVLAAGVLDVWRASFERVFAPWPSLSGGLKVGDHRYKQNSQGNHCCSGEEEAPFMGAGSDERQEEKDVGGEAIAHFRSRLPGAHAREALFRFWQKPMMETPIGGALVLSCVIFVASLLYWGAYHVPTSNRDHLHVFSLLLGLAGATLLVEGFAKAVGIKTSNLAGGAALLALMLFFLRLAHQRLSKPHILVSIVAAGLSTIIVIASSVLVKPRRNPEAANRADVVTTVKSARVLGGMVLVAFATFVEIRLALVHP
jgi:hypothetical protein